MSPREPLLDRFIRYAKIDTQSSDTSTSYPSTEKQKDLLRVLVDDLKAAGLADAAMDEWGYVMATLPSNVPADHPARGGGLAFVPGRGRSDRPTESLSRPAFRAVASPLVRQPGANR